MFKQKGIQDYAIDSIFSQVTPESDFEVFVTFYEIYGGRLYDLLNKKKKLSVLEDGKGKVQIHGIHEVKTESADDLRNEIQLGNSVRTTHNTVTNATSSRSHAICTVILKRKGEEQGKLLLIDLAGSERAQETQHNNRQRLAEGAEINKSLLALKECIRAMDARKHGIEKHVPFRASKLTLVLRDSFLSKNENSKIMMIACVSPGYNSVNHTINTLRYSDKLKERKSILANLKHCRENQGNMSDYDFNDPLMEEQIKANVLS